MKHSTRFVLMVSIAALFGVMTGCIPSAYEKGLKHYRPDDPVAAARQLKPLAEKGDMEAQFSLGSLYYQGRGAPQDYREAVKWFRRAADQGHLYAQVNLGTIYAEGVQGVIDSDQTRALMWLIFAASKGDMEALEFRDSLTAKMTPAQITEAQKMAREYQPETAYTKLLRELKPLAEKGDAVAQFRIGVMTYNGQGVARNLVEAMQWFKKSAQQGNHYAQHNVGYMYEKGEGAPQDYAEAAKWYRLAAERGNAGAQYTLGYMYEKGQGVVQDEVQALMWFNLAAAQGDARAKTARERVTVWMDQERINEAQRLAREFKIVAGK